MKDKINNTEAKRSDNMSEETAEQLATAAINHIVKRAHSPLQQDNVQTSYVVLGFHELPNGIEGEVEGHMFAKTITIIDNNPGGSKTKALELMREGNSVAGAATFVKNHKLTETLLEMALEEAVIKSMSLRQMPDDAYEQMIAETYQEQPETSEGGE